MSVPRKEYTVHCTLFTLGHQGDGTALCPCSKAAVGDLCYCVCSWTLSVPPSLCAPRRLGPLGGYRDDTGSPKAAGHSVLKAALGTALRETKVCAPARAPRQGQYVPRRHTVID